MLVCIVSASHEDLRDKEFIIKGVKYNLEDISKEDLPHLYESLDLYYDDALLKIDHPRWLPEDLPDDIFQKLHFWYFKGNQLKETGDTYNAYILFYSAGCLGHILAAVEAGAMLLNPEYNETIPLITTYDMLEPEVQEYDIRRLNEPYDITPGLEEIIKRNKVSEAYDGSGILREGYYTSMALSLIKEAIEDVDKLEQTDEVRAVKMLFYGLFHYIEGNEYANPQDFRPEATRQFIRSCDQKTYTMESVLFDDSEDEEYYEYVKRWYDKHLNGKLVKNYATSLKTFIFDLEKKEGTTHIINKNTLESEEYLHKAYALEMASILLGGKRYGFYLGMLESEATAFLYHLVFTRDSSKKCFDSNKRSLGYLLLPINPCRLEMLENYFNSPL